MNTHRINIMCVFVIRIGYFDTFDRKTLCFCLICFQLGVLTHTALLSTAAFSVTFLVCLLNNRYILSILKRILCMNIDGKQKSLSLSRESL